MSPHLRRLLFGGSLLCVAVLAAVAVVARLQASGPTGTTSPASDRVPVPVAIGTELQRPPRVPDVSLVDASGHRTSLAAFRGRWLVLAPSMTLCTEVCPMTTGALIQLTDAIHRAGLSSRVAVAEATVDPWRDTPARLRAYRRLAGVNFSMLTGSPEEIHRLWSFFGIWYHRTPEGRPADIDWMTHRPLTFDVAHQDGIIFVSPSGQERIVDTGMPDVHGRLSPDLRRLLSGEGRANLAHPQEPWTAGEALQDVESLMGRTMPAHREVDRAPSAAAVRRSLADSPRPLAALHARAGRVIGSSGALRAELRALRGRYPVVLNVWASWCEGCRGEFGLLAGGSARYGRRVAFLGADYNDSTINARRFLAGHPVSYPSFAVSDGGLSWLAAVTGMPTTIYFDRAGRITHVHAFPYGSAAGLDNDVEHYALGASTG